MLSVQTGLTASHDVLPQPRYGTFINTNHALLYYIQHPQHNAAASLIIVVGIVSMVSVLSFEAFIIWLVMFKK